MPKLNTEDLLDTIVNGDINDFKTESENLECNKGNIAQDCMYFFN